MATRQFPASFVARYAAATITKAEADWKAKEAEHIAELQERTVTEGWLWWKTTRNRTLEEARRYYETDAWEPDVWASRAFALKRMVDGHFRERIARLQLLRNMALVQPGSPMVTLHEDEARRLGIQP